MGKPKIYQEEFKFIFGEKALCVRGAAVTCVFIEGQIFLLAKNFLQAHSVNYKPRKHNELRQSLNVLETNKKLQKKELKAIENFLTKRNEIVHGVFKGMTRTEWEEKNKEVVELGRSIIKILDEKLYPLKKPQSGSN